MTSKYNKLLIILISNLYQKITRQIGNICKIRSSHNIKFIEKCGKNLIK